MIRPVARDLARAFWGQPLYPRLYLFASDVAFDELLALEKLSDGGHVPRGSSRGFRFTEHRESPVLVVHRGSRSILSRIIPRGEHDTATHARAAGHAVRAWKGREHTTYAILGGLDFGPGVERIFVLELREELFEGKMVPMWHSAKTGLVPWLKKTLLPFRYEEQTRI